MVADSANAPAGFTAELAQVTALEDPSDKMLSLIDFQPCNSESANAPAGFTVKVASLIALC